MTYAEEIAADYRESPEYHDAPEECCSDCGRRYWWERLTVGAFAAPSTRAARPASEVHRVHGESVSTNVDSAGNQPEHNQQEEELP